MNNNVSNQELIQDKSQNQDVEYQGSSLDNKISQNQFFENKIIEKLTTVEDIIDEAIKKHGDKKLILNKRNDSSNGKY